MSDFVPANSPYICTTFSILQPLICAIFKKNYSRVLMGFNNIEGILLFSAEHEVIYCKCDL